jgi:hypothetical protein
LYLAGNKAVWAEALPDEGKEGHHYLTAEQLCDWLDFLVDNTFFLVGDHLFHQRIGIPMGTNCAVFLANLFLFTFELAYLTTLVKQGNTEAVLRFLRTVRYLDDLLSVDNPDFDTLKYSLYPQDMLELNCEQEGNNVHFLDTRIRFTTKKSNPYRQETYDKRSDPKFGSLPMSKYPHASSFLPDKFKYNIVYSECYRFASRCSSRRSFVFNLSKLLVELSRKGLCQTRLLARATTFLNLHVPLYHCYNPTTLVRKLKNRMKLMLRKSFTFTDPHPP